MTHDLRTHLARLTAARSKGIRWLLEHMSPDGRPEGCEQGNGWTRLSLALALGGETAAASAAMEWALCEGLDADGNFRSGPARGTGMVGAYLLGQLAMGALQLERYDVARLVLDRLEALQDPYGGMPIEVSAGNADASATPQGTYINKSGSPLAHISDITSTAQVGLAALHGGRLEMAARIRDWFLRTLELQPELPHILYTGRVGAELVTTPPPGAEFLLAVDYRKPRQAYYYSGSAAAFLGAYAMQTGDKEALAAGHRFLALNIGGVEEQFTDADSVQICKFGWGVAVMQIADPGTCYKDHLVRMSEWFIDHQDEDGSWIPSRFFSPSPTVVERMMKTSEHAMEVTALMAALAVVSARG